MKRDIILFLLLFWLISHAGSGLEIPSKAVGTVSPSKGAIYLTPPTPDIPDAMLTLCQSDNIYNFNYKFDMTPFLGEGLDVILLVYNPETQKWMKAGTKEYDGTESTIEFNVSFLDLINENVEYGGSYRFRPFIGMSKFKLVKGGDQKIRTFNDGLGVQVDSANTPAVGLRESLSDEIIGPEIIANFRNAQWSKNQFEETYTYSIEARSSEPLNVVIVGTKDDKNWEVYREESKKIRPDEGSFGWKNWKKLIWNKAPSFCKLEFVIDGCN